jgi:iron complex transport system ATP-binding protein
MTGIDNILSFRELQIGFGSGNKKRLLLPPVSEDAGKGELIAVIGRNGIGKSTLLRTLAGIQKPLAGEVLYNGISIDKLDRSDLARITGYTSTEILKVSNMKVFDLVSLGRYPYTNWFGTISAEDHDIIQDAMEKTSVAAFSDRFIAELSDGERQKTMIARMLAQNTFVMLMDEPTAFLDIRGKFEVLNLMRNLSHNAGKTIIFTTHDLSMALSHADKIWLVLDKTMKDGAPEDLLMKGDFDHLFDSSYVEFNAVTATYSLRTENKGSFHIAGEGTKLHWTREAIKRAGYTVSETATMPFIEIMEDKWLLRSGDYAKEFNSIYELVKGIGLLQRNSI